MSAPIRYLLVLRHAKADGPEPGGSDFERRLKARGARAAQRAGRFLRESEQEPQRILCSSAVRARETVELAAEAGAWSATPEFLPELYETTAESVLQLVSATTPDVTRLLVAGHEPTSSAVVALLTGARPPLFPTAALACIAFAGEWSELCPGAGSLAWLIAPNALE